MNRIAFYIVAAFMILLLDHTPGHAVPVPHDFQCLQCHVNHNQLGTQTNDLVCLTCHNPSGGARAQSYPFSAGDAANPYGTSDGLQTSHNWSGSDTNPRAGAQPPLDPAMALSQHEGKMSCAKCHNLHGPRESATNSAPFLRMLNDRDQMCFDCHRSRNTKDHTLGTHPVQVNYTSAFRARPYAFYSAPRLSSTTNPTANLKLNDGQVICSTCHGVHYTDSHSSTFDGNSSALLGKLKPSNGYLLRATLKGKAADDLNLCTHCHKEYRAHNAGGENVQCTNCHGGHADEGDGKGPNVWLVSRYESYSTFRGKVDLRAQNKPIFFQSTLKKNYIDANGTGVCQPCHKNNSTQAECSQPEQNCNRCHRHNNVNGSFAPETLDCTSCHGQPPVVNREGSPDGYAAGYVGVDEGTSAHKPHMNAAGYLYTCNDCHKGNLHGSGDFQQVFPNPDGTIAGSYGATATYDKTSRNCLTSYCHSNGAPRGEAIKYRSVPFGNSQGSIIGKANECVSCHGGALGAYNNLSTGAHFKHVSLNSATGKGYGCATCHATVVSGNGTVSDRTKHVNGQKEISFSGSFTAGTTSDGVTCATNYCHSNGKNQFTVPNWTVRSSGACGACHPTATGMGSTTISTGAHFAHFSSSADSYGPMFTTRNATGCQQCHPYTGEFAGNHVDGSVQWSQADYSPAGTGTCSPCHKQTTSWTGGQVSCESCHIGAANKLSVINGVTAPEMSRLNTQGHGKYAGTYPELSNCLTCHSTSARHFNGNGRLLPAMTGTPMAECNYCHDDPAKVPAQFRNMSTHMLQKGGGQQMTCGTCHDPHGTSNLSEIRTVINGKTITYTNAVTGMVNTTTNQGLCQVCHTQTTHFLAGVPETNHPTTDCLNCHKHGATGGAFKPAGACDSCHGYPPAPRVTTTVVSFGTMGNWTGARFESYSGGGGAHLVAAHVPKNAKPSDGWIHCTMCHNGGRADNMATPNHLMALPVRSHVSDITIDMDQKYRFDSRFTVYTGQKLVNPPQRNVTGSCFNISCHMSPSKPWSIER